MLVPRQVVQARNEETKAFALDIQYGSEYKNTAIFHFPSNTSLVVDQVTATWGNMAISVSGLIV